MVGGKIVRMKEDRPLWSADGNFVRLVENGANSTVYEFSNHRGSFVLKELKATAEIYAFVNDDPFSAARVLNRLYELVKKHYGEKMSDTMFIVARNRKGMPAVITVQEKVEGKPLSQVIKEGDGRMALAMHVKAEEYGDLWDEVVRDRGWKKLPSGVRKHYRKDDMHIDNIFLTPDGRFIVVDF